MIFVTSTNISTVLKLITHGNTIIAVNKDCTVMKYNSRLEVLFNFLNVSGEYQSALINDAIDAIFILSKDDVIIVALFVVISIDKRSITTIAVGVSAQTL